MDRSDRNAALGIGGAVAACCAVHLLILAGGVGALTGVLSNAYVLAGGVALLTVAAVAVLSTRRRGCAESPAPDHPEADSAASEESHHHERSYRLRRDDRCDGARPDRL